MQKRGFADAARPDDRYTVHIGHAAENLAKLALAAYEMPRVAESPSRLKRIGDDLLYHIRLQNLRRASLMILKHPCGHSNDFFRAKSIISARCKQDRRWTGAKPYQQVARLT